MRSLYVVLLLLSSQHLPAQETGGDPETGAGLYLRFACYNCHGYNGTGTPPLSGGARGALSSEQLFLTYLRLRADQNPVNPSRSMPNYSAATLSDEQARDIYAYLLTLDDEAPELEEIPAFVEILESAERRTGDDTEQR